MRIRVLPASAGMIPLPDPYNKTNYSAPRIRGDDPHPRQRGLRQRQCSPHPRG